jgi:hypothetical protein
MKTIFRIKIVILLMGVILCSNNILYAQQEQSLIYGSVVEKYSSGEITLNGVKIEIYNSDSLVAATMTSETGNFSFNNMPYGTYHLKVKATEEENQMYQKQDDSKEQTVNRIEGKYFSFSEKRKSTKIKFTVNSPETNISKITVYPLD